MYKKKVVCATPPIAQTWSFIVSLEAPPHSISPDVALNDS
jgi:hypothetical protein